MTPRGDEDEELWSALGDPTRVRLLDLLLERNDTTASALAKTLPITRQAIAKHLTVLERAGLVEPRRVGREVRFSVRPDRLDRARLQMAQVASRWDQRLVLIKEMAQEAHRAARQGDDEPSTT
jgi:DNA-binding transcriptional ArsR family regulator